MRKFLSSSFCLLAGMAGTYAGISGLETLGSANQLALSVLQEDWSPNEIKKLDRPGFSLTYPADWTVATQQEDFDADRLFTIEVANADSYITIKIFVPDADTDADDIMFSILTTLDGPMIETYSRDSFEQWGNFKGQGRHLKGKIAGFLPGGARIFVSTDGPKGILVTELYYSDDLDKAMPGFDLIRKSFVFKQ
ncbi:hypothetical protein H5P28_04820 [Ruficoccus amylovorans]|uniref:Uncharacterized protein n=1 Tax=Ruficoccus amylovorans TaxID=1804625 RepID=A0A842HBN9_9BACT|nr:hypothetical protein [Ruficoccus amylovorans]MBC2593579.1 hypothetical protein [Ruficoccus amylovorans]